jgi:outer membrane receptor protein involved in Fe transport
MHHFNRRRAVALLATASVSALAGQALAQDASDTIEEVVVTATRQADTINRVPLSVSAVTQKGLDQQGVRNLYDLSRVMPSVTFRRGGGDGRTDISMRGIISGAGAATTGVYLDDTALQKRNAEGAVPGNGSPFPPLFDLERVEVLRGPQGTLYGGSSQGGTIRFITPAPSLTKYSAYGRAEGSLVKGGDPGGEIGLAVGGPIVQDKLGFRASAFYSHVGGYIDHILPYNRKQVLTDSNSEDHKVLRVALLWRPTEKLIISPAYYWYRGAVNDLDNFWSNVPAFTAPGGSFGATGQAATGAAARFVRPAVNYPALDFYGPGKVGTATKSPRYNHLDVASLTIDYDLDWVNLKSITSYTMDVGKGRLDQSIGEAYNLIGFGGGYQMAFPDFFGLFQYANKRNGITQEIRLSSPAGARPVSWIAGVYYAHYEGKVYSVISEDLDVVTRNLRGVSAEVYYGVPILSGNRASLRDQTLDETSLAAFGEATWHVNDQLRVIGGVRITKETFDYVQSSYGQLSGYNVPTVANGGLSAGKVKESPVTPKVGLQYQIDDRNMVYATAAKGFRMGAVNGSVPVASCAAGLAAMGGSVPSTVKSDSVWSYEAGAKLRLFGGRAQLNSSIFMIDWSDIQLRLTVPGCQFQFATNAGKARSRGADLQLQAKLFSGLSTNLSVGYTDARYSETTLGPKPTTGSPVIIVNKGDELPVPAWSASLGLQYDFHALGRDAYIRGDYQYTSPYKRTLGPSTTAYAPDVYRAEATNIINARIGVQLDKVDLSLFVNNLANSQDATGLGGGAGTCNQQAVCSRNNYLLTGITFRPRTIGATATFRY